MIIPAHPLRCTDKGVEVGGDLLLQAGPWAVGPVLVARLQAALVTQSVQPPKMTLM